MNDKELKLIYGYMGWSLTQPCLDAKDKVVECHSITCYDCVHYRRLNSNSASECMKEIVRKGDDVDFIENNRANRQIRNAKSRANSAQAIATVAMVTAMSRR